MQNQPGQNAQELMQQGVAAMRRADFRFAELAFRRLAREGQGDFSVQANLALSLIYQQRWWEGVAHLHGALKAVPQEQNTEHLAQIKAGLEQLAGMLERRQLTGDAADGRGLARALDPFPTNLVTLAARWLPTLSQANQARVLLDFLLWLQAAEPQRSFSGADIERLARLAATHPANERFVPLLVWGLVQHLDFRQELPEGWSLAVQSMAALCRSAVVNRYLYIAMAAVDLLLKEPSGDFHLAFTDLLPRLLVGDSPLAPESLQGWTELFSRLHPQLDTLNFRVMRTNNLYQVYNVAAGEQGWSEVWARCFEEGALDGYDWKDLLYLCGELGFLLAYRSASLGDRQRLNQVLGSRLAQAMAQEANSQGLDPLARPPVRKAGPGPLRIAYLTHTVQGHSVGYLLDILLRHHSADVEVYVYDSGPPGADKDELGKAIIAGAAQYRSLPVFDVATGAKAARRIRDDGIQLLVDLDGLTQPAHLFIHYFRPATASCVYMGFDPCGVPFVDYFLVDPHALPADAGDYLAERPFRLARHTWVPDGYAGAVDPDTREQVRSRLEIPEGAVVYLIAAPGRKLSAEIAEDAAEILRRVPEGMLLIKAKGNLQWMERFWKERAAQHGVDPQRVRFLTYTPTPAAHRAQLRAADVVLDTFPFNGGMHSFENLWLGNPVVTRYGETYPSRLTYSMLKNLGVEETIAASREEYRETAVRLGLDRELREEIRGRLMSAVQERRGIWDTPGLMRELEAGFRGMVKEKAGR